MATPVLPKLASLTVGVVSIAHDRVNERNGAQLGVFDSLSVVRRMGRMRHSAAIVAVAVLAGACGSDGTDAVTPNGAPVATEVDQNELASRPPLDDDAFDAFVALVVAEAEDRFVDSYPSLLIRDVDPLGGSALPEDSSVFYFTDEDPLPTAVLDAAEGARVVLVTGQERSIEELRAAQVLVSEVLAEQEIAGVVDFPRQAGVYPPINGLVVFGEPEREAEIIDAIRQHTDVSVPIAVRELETRTLSRTNGSG